MNVDNTKYVGRFLMATGFLWGAFVIVKHPGMVEWGPYAVAFVITAIGAGTLRYVAAQAGSEKEKLSADMSVIEKSLRDIVSKVHKMNEDKATASTFSFCTRIDN